jgi:hypothetical protein
VREEFCNTEIESIKLTCDPVVPSIDHQKYHAHYKMSVIPIMYSTFQGIYALSMWWAAVIGLEITEPWDLSTESLLIYFAVGLLTFKKAPPWLMHYLLISSGFQLVSY